MGRLLELPNDVGVLIGTFVPLDKIVVNTNPKPSSLQSRP